MLPFESLATTFGVPVLPVVTVPSKVVSQARIVSLECTGPCSVSPETNEISLHPEPRLFHACRTHDAPAPEYTGSWIS